MKAFSIDWFFQAMEAIMFKMKFSKWFIFRQTNGALKVLNSLVFSFISKSPFVKS